MRAPFSGPYTDPVDLSNAVFENILYEFESRRSFRDGQQATTNVQIAERRNPERGHVVPPEHSPFHRSLLEHSCSLFKMAVPMAEVSEALRVLAEDGPPSASLGGT